MNTTQAQAAGAPTITSKAVSDERIFITPQDIERTGFASARRVMELCKQGRIKAARFGHTWRIYRREFCDQYGITDVDF